MLQLKKSRGSEDKRKTEQVLQMKKDWDARAARDAIYFTAPCHFTATYQQPCMAANYFRYGRMQAYILTHDSFRELAFEPTGKRILEIGCGIGRLLPGFSEIFNEVWGVDVSEEMISRGAKLQVSSNIRLMQNNGYDLAGIPGQYFDFVFSYNALQHVPQEWMVFNYLEEVYRVIRSGGAFQLHFRTNKKSFRSYAYWLLPYPLRKPAQILFRLMLLYPLRHLPLHIRAPGISGGSASWVGTGFSPIQIEAELTRLGFIRVRTLSDKGYPEGTKFWAIGKKP